MAEDTAAATLEEAKKIVIRLDPTLPAAKLLKIRELKTDGVKRVCVKGWVHRIRRQGVFEIF